MRSWAERPCRPRDKVIEPSLGALYPLSRLRASGSLREQCNRAHSTDEETEALKSKYCAQSLPSKRRLGQESLPFLSNSQDPAFSTNMLCPPVPNWVLLRGRGVNSDSCWKPDTSSILHTTLGVADYAPCMFGCHGNSISVAAAFPLQPPGPVPPPELQDGLRAPQSAGPHLGRAP